MYTMPMFKIRPRSPFEGLGKEEPEGFFGPTHIGVPNNWESVARGGGKKNGVGKLAIKKKKDICSQKGRKRILATPFVRRGRGDETALLN